MVIGTISNPHYTGKILKSATYHSPLTHLSHTKRVRKRLKKELNSSSDLLDIILCDLPYYHGVCSEDGKAIEFDSNRLKDLILKNVWEETSVSHEINSKVKKKSKNPPKSNPPLHLCFDEISIKSVPLYRARTREEYEATKDLWPINFHEDKSLVEDSFFADCDLRRVEGLLQRVLEEARVAEAEGNVSRGRNQIKRSIALLIPFLIILKP